jgi:3-hydroxybutyryl-CoA dehydratase
MELFEHDFDDLQPGMAFRTLGRTITEADVVGFATLTGDLHPQHVDAAWAAESPFGGRIAHGMLVLSYAVGLVSFDPERAVALRRVRDVVFKRPVAIGDTIHVEGEIERTAAVDAETGLVGCNWRVVHQSGKLVVRAGVEVLWRRGVRPRVSSNGAGVLESLPLTM